MRKRKINPNAIINLYLDGYSNQYIKSTCNIGDTTLYRTLRENNIKSREAQKIKITDFTVNTPEKAYTLGFLWGDGFVPKNKHHYPSFGIVKDDFNQIIDLFKCWGKWNIYDVQHPNRKKQGYATLSNTLFGEFLIENDYTIKSKASPTKILSNISEEFRCYFWRGYSDADGCFRINIKHRTRQFVLAGSFEQDWKDIELLFKQLGIKRYSIRRRTQHNVEKTKTYHNSIIETTNKFSIQKLGEYIYKDNIMMGLQRKYKKYQMIMSSYSS